MKSQALSAVLKDLGTQNARYIAIYREWARRMPPGPVMRLAFSIAEQRGDLGKTLAELQADQALNGVDIEIEQAFAADPPIPENGKTFIEAKALLKLIADAELADHERLACLAGLILPASSNIADRLASEAASAHKRSVWAQDQLELLSM